MSSSFSSLGVPAGIQASLSELGIVEPYPIQIATLPDGLAGLDVLAQSPTGSGKTLAFAIPLVARVQRANRARPHALVLAPTRELAAQIAREITPLAEAASRRVATFYGGCGFGEQLSALRRGADIAVGCPGRLIDLLDRGALMLDEVEIVVVDEVDRMADMGFLPAVRRLLDEVDQSRQAMFFSATLSSAVERLVRDYQRDPRRHVLRALTDDVSSRSHELWRTEREHRAALTAQLVASYRSSIVFCRTKHGVDRLTKTLTRAGVSATALHGGRSQAQRDRALLQFREGRVQVLVGTDVAGRGIHVDGVDCVVHYDPPEDEDTYVHRSGRTGRAGSSGVVISLVSPDQEPATRRLHRQLGLTTKLGGTPGAPIDLRDQRSERPVTTNGAVRENKSPAGTRPANARQRPRRRQHAGPARQPRSRQSTTR